MRQARRFSLLVFSLLSITIFAGPLACKGPVKEPAVAGAFYPGDEVSLRNAVKEYLNRAENKPFEGDLIALVSPHAGYVFSGQIAAYGYKHLLSGGPIDTVILIGPSHHTSFIGASVYTEGSFKTPLGLVKIDEHLAKSLINDKAGVTFYPEAFEKEHSLEVQLPFLQEALKNFKIVPILLGSPSRESFEHLASRLAGVISKRKGVLLIASTDFSHYYNYETAMRMDSKMIDALERLSVMEAEKVLFSGEGEMCGAYPVLVVMDTARRLGANSGVVFKRANSGDVMGDKNRVVGYVSMGIYRTALDEKEKAELLTLAKGTIMEFVKNKKMPEYSTDNPKFKADGAVFVTINRQGRLRGCIGNIQPVMPLYKSVLRNAVAASSDDYRFIPMTPDELSDMEVEVSVLSPLMPVGDFHEIEVGKHGLYIMKDGRAGVLLPQVPVALGWDRETFLKEVSEKAGLPPDAYKSGANLYKFTADIIK